jgi:hypothetical protein
MQPVAREQKTEVSDQIADGCERGAKSLERGGRSARFDFRNSEIFQQNHVLLMPPKIPGCLPLQSGTVLDKRPVVPGRALETRPGNKAQLGELVA